MNNQEAREPESTGRAGAARLDQLLRERGLRWEGSEELRQLLAEWFPVFIENEVSPTARVDLSYQVLQLDPRQPLALRIKRRFLFDSAERMLEGGHLEAALVEFRAAEKIRLAGADEPYLDILRHFRTALEAYTQGKWGAASQAFHWLMRHSPDSISREQVRNLAARSAGRARLRVIRAAGLAALAVILLAAVFAAAQYLPAAEFVSGLLRRPVREPAALTAPARTPPAAPVSPAAVPSPATAVSAAGGRPTAVLPTPTSTLPPPTQTPAGPAARAPITRQTVSRLAPAGTPLAADDMHPARVMAVSDHFLAYANDAHGISLVDIETGARDSLPLAREFWGSFDALSFSPGGKYLAAGASDGRLRVWKIAAGDAAEPPFEPCTSENWPLHRAAVSSVSFAPDAGRLTLISGDQVGFVVRCDILTQERASYNHQFPVENARPAPQPGYVAIQSHMATVRLVDFEKMTWLRELEQHRKKVVSLAVSGATIATGAEDSTIRFDDASQPQNPTALDQPRIHANEIYHLAFSPDGSLLASDGAGSLKIWDAETGTALQTFPGRAEPGDYSMGVFSPDGRLFFAVMQKPTGEVTVRMYAVEE